MIVVEWALTVNLWGGGILDLISKDKDCNKYSKTPEKATEIIKNPRTHSFDSQRTGAPKATLWTP